MGWIWLPFHLVVIQVYYRNDACAVVGNDEDLSLSWKRAVESKLRYVVVSSKREFRVILCLKKRCRSLCLVPVGVVGNSDAQGNQIHFASHNRKCSSRLILRKRCSRNPTGRRKPHEGCDVWSMGCLLLDLFLRSRTAAKTWSDECFDTSSKIASRCGGRPVSIQAAARGSQEKLTTMEIGKKRLLHQLLQGESESQHLR